jgi:hypothetical protein
MLHVAFGGSLIEGDSHGLRFSRTTTESAIEWQRVFL